MEAIYLCFTFLSLSAVLASISVALRNFALTALLQPNIDNILIGDDNKSYAEVLERSVIISSIAGIVFIANTIISFIVSGYIIYKNSTSIDLVVPFIILSIGFLIGMVLFLFCLVHGHLNIKWSTPKRGPETKPQEPQSVQTQTQPIRQAKVPPRKPFSKEQPPFQPFNKF
jgi:hypothetical protein